VLESRRSVRDHGERVPTRGELAELLYRAARVRAVVAGGAHGQLTNRPYPSAGAAYPLELYPVVGRGSGLERGIYHYDPVGHTVRRTGAGEEAVRDLLDQARQSAGLDGEPPLVLMVIARFDRMSARHGGSPYSGLLADVGALVQTLYLVATAMGLAPCALADGTVRLEARALGLDWRRESPVGGFVLGSVPRGSAGEPPPGSNTVPVNGPDWAETCHLLLRPLRERRAAAAGASTG
jgi:SagB-type dehydrogenase family enzyme